MPEEVDGVGFVSQQLTPSLGATWDNTLENPHHVSSLGIPAKFLRIIVSHKTKSLEILFQKGLNFSFSNSEGSLYFPLWDQSNLHTHSSSTWVEFKFLFRYSLLTAGCMLHSPSWHVFIRRGKSVNQVSLRLFKLYLAHNNRRALCQQAMKWSME